MDRQLESDLEGLDSPITRLDPTSQVARRLLAHVSNGRLGPGTRLPSERQLAADMQVGRSAVRQALAALSLLGIIEIRQGSGNYVVSDSSNLLPQAIKWGLMLGRPKIQELVEIRGNLEVVSAKLAARNADASQIEELEKCLALMVDAAQDLERFTAADMAFHTQLAAMSGNSVLSDILSTISSLLEVWIERAVVNNGGDTSSTITEHRAVYAAVAALDSDLAVSAMTHHMRQASGRLWSSSDEA